MNGIEVKELELRPDDRGFFCELYRQDWRSFFDEQVVQFNLSSSFPGTVRAWHRHAQGQVDYFIVVEGALRICAYDGSTRELFEVVVSHRRLSAVRMPGHYYHGTMAVGNTSALTLYGTTRLYDYDDPDEERLPWNDAGVKPAVINGRSDDPRAGRPWDWFYPSHR